MADINPRRSGELMRGVFAILLEHPDGLQAGEVLKELEHRIPPTEFEKRTIRIAPASVDSRSWCGSSPSTRSKQGGF